MANERELYFASPSMLTAAKGPFMFSKAGTAARCLVHFDVNIDLLNQQPCMKEGSAATIINKLLPNQTHGISYEALTGRKAVLKFE